MPDMTMKKYFSSAVMAAAAFMLAFTSCAKIEEATDNSVVTPDGEATAPSTEMVTMTVSIPEEGFTKVSFTPDVNEEGKPIVKLAWEDTDVLIINEKEFAIDPESISEDGKTAKFKGEDPGDGPYTITYTNVSGDMNAQTQSSDNNTGHLGYAATLANVDTYTSVQFNSEWAEEHNGTFSQSGVLHVQAKLPTAAIADAVKKVVIRTKENVLNGSNAIAVTLSKAGVEGDGQVINVYATLTQAATLSADTELFFDFQVDAEKSYKKYTAYRKLNAEKILASGSLNEFKINCDKINVSAGPADNGTADAPYLIADQNQMNAIHGKLTTSKTYYRMLDDIDMTGISWAPLMPNGNELIDFDGGNHTLANISAPSANYVSIFGLLTGRVANLTIDKATITPGGQRAGVLASYIGTGTGAGEVSNVTITNSNVGTSSKKGTNYCGVLASYVNNSSTTISDVTINECSVYSTYDCVGGMIATTNTKNATFTGCHINNSTVVGGNNTGGFVGVASGKYSNCSVNAKVTGGHQTGGFAGHTSAKTTIDQCYTAGSVAGTNNVGGFVGWAQYSLTMNNCYSVANVGSSSSRAGNRVGGLVGHYTKNSVSNAGPCSVSNCFATGDIYAASPVGGLIGQAAETDCTLQNCIAWNATVNASFKVATAAPVIGNSHQNATLINNYRRAGMSVSTTWTDWDNFNHGNAGSNAALTDSNGSPLSGMGPYFGKVDADKTLSQLASTTLGWSSDIWDFSGELPVLK